MATNAKENKVKQKKGLGKIMVVKMLEILEEWPGSKILQNKIATE